MKKMLAIALVLMLVPFSAFGLEMLEDATLDTVTGQAGVSIATDVTMDIHFDTIAWGDSDGLDADNTDSAGWVGITDLDITNMNIKIRQDYALAGLYDQIQLFTIDVATTDLGQTYVHMILGTQQVTFDSMDGVVELGANTDLGDVLGDFYIGTFALYMNPDSFVDIMAHGDAGVTINFGVSIDSISMAAMSWGDADGIGTGTIDGLVYNGDGDATNNLFTTAGYVGLSGAFIDDLAVSGKLLIDVATVDFAAVAATAYFDSNADGVVDLPEAYLLGIYAQMFATGYDIGTSAVLMQFNDLKVTMASFSADVVLASNNTLTAGAGTLGSVYAAGMDVTMNGWVGIFAH
ncbi:MAG: hypothetical protein KQI81_23485 [Deltaproteobacteria bacterium]|nr:hypothetical protein [Deltaproteobacteria bacterium]